MREEVTPCSELWQERRMVEMPSCLRARSLVSLAPLVIGGEGPLLERIALQDQRSDEPRRRRTCGSLFVRVEVLVMSTCIDVAC